MSLTLPDTALITTDELDRDSLSGFSLDITGQDQDAAIAAIIDVTTAIEMYLDRNIICRQHTEYVPAWRWTYSAPRYAWVFTPPAFPVVEVSTSNVMATEDKRSLQCPTRVDKITYTAGWRRSDQDKSNFNTSSNPELLPGDIRRVAVRLALYELQDAKQGTHATDRKTVNTGEFTATVERKREDVYVKELTKLNKYRRLV